MYSNSRIETFEQCPRKYRFRYIDNVRSELESIEAFVGKRVHEVLEKLYRDLRYTKLNTLDELLLFYEQIWAKLWHAKVVVTRSEFTPGHYFAYGQKCLENYYRRHHPFNDGNTIGLEERIAIKVRDGDKEYALQGYIDRLVWIPATNTYEIHDYKTGSSVPSQEEADGDRQLALYQLGLLQRWPDAANIRLVWHYLAADKDIVSSRSAVDLASLEREIIRLIHDIENTRALGQWDVRVGRVCDWCEYKPLCPAFKHAASTQTLPPNRYLQDNGVQLVEKYAALEAAKAELQAELQEVQAEQNQVAEAIFTYGAENDLVALDGINAQIHIKSEEEWAVPRKGEDAFSWEMLRNVLKNAGKLEDVSTVNANMLKFGMRRGQWGEDLVKNILQYVKRRVQKSIVLLRKD